MPFTFKDYVVLVLQRQEEVMLVFANSGQDVRRIRLNASHPQPLTPSRYGDSVGH